VFGTGVVIPWGLQECPYINTVLFVHDVDIDVVDGDNDDSNSGLEKGVCMPKVLDREELIGAVLRMDAAGVPVKEQAATLGISVPAYIKRMQRWGFRRLATRRVWEPTGERR